jgi:hypothetical protein
MLHLNFYCKLIAMCSQECSDSCESRGSRANGSMCRQQRLTSVQVFSISNVNNLFMAGNVVGRSYLFITSQPAEPARST